MIPRRPDRLSPTMILSMSCHCGITDTKTGRRSVIVANGHSSAASGSPSAGNGEGVRCQRRWGPLPTERGSAGSGEGIRWQRRGGPLATGDPPPPAIQKLGGGARELLEPMEGGSCWAPRETGSFCFRQNFRLRCGKSPSRRPSRRLPLPTVVPDSTRAPRPPPAPFPLPPRPSALLARWQPNGPPRPLPADPGSVIPQ